MAQELEIRQAALVAGNDLCVRKRGVAGQILVAGIPSPRAAVIVPFLQPLREKHGFLHARSGYSEIWLLVLQNYHCIHRPLIGALAVIERALPFADSPKAILAWLGKPEMLHSTA